MSLHFECSGCGACCRRIETAVLATQNIEELKFPYTWDKDGKCDMLNDDNTCKVYEDRPLLCNVEKIADHFKLEKKGFYKLNHKSCLEMQKIDNVEEKFKLKL